MPQFVPRAFQFSGSPESYVMMGWCSDALPYTTVQSVKLSGRSGAFVPDLNVNLLTSSHAIHLGLLSQHAKRLTNN